MTFQELITGRESLDQIPTQCGVYLFKGRRGEGLKREILYVGKAKNLRSRVRQYFVGTGDGRAFSLFLQERVEEIRTIVVASEHDALLLESELIKKYRPPCNILLKDDKRYLSLRLDRSHEWPRLEVVRRIKKDRATYLGPFSSARGLRTTLDLMQKVFPLRTCDDRKLYNRSRPCIEYEIKRCVAPCVNFVTPEAYKNLVGGAVAFLQGEDTDLVGRLEKEMQTLAEEDRFEEAAVVRDRLRAVETTLQGQEVIGLNQQKKGLHQDVIGVAVGDGMAVVSLVYVRSGLMFDKRQFEFRNVLVEKEEILSQFLDRYYGDEVFQPDEILVPFSVPETMINNVIVPRAKEKWSFVEIAQSNAEAALATLVTKSKKLGVTLERLQKLLHLQRLPMTMDCIDISHHQGLQTVASVVRFSEGRPDTSGYRKIKLKADRVDDFDSMREAISRRYKSVEDLPDLLVVDGGRGQLSAVVQILEDRELLSSLEVVSLAKARDVDEIDPLNPMNRERIFKPGQKNPILLKEDSAEELLLRHLRDEAHRFAITFHRDRKDSQMSASLLDEVPGISDKTKIKLLREFGSVDALITLPDEALLRLMNKRQLAALRLTIKERLRDDSSE
jgi:excinuclease ABC subunit C